MGLLKNRFLKYGTLVLNSGKEVGLESFNSRCIKYSTVLVVLALEQTELLYEELTQP